MDYWSFLNIEPTSDTNAIKKAYAVLLKENKPDENPAGFAQLHQAYKYCLKEAKYYSETSEDTAIEEAPNLTLNLKKRAALVNYSLVEDAQTNYSSQNNDQPTQDLSDTGLGDEELSDKKVSSETGEAYVIQDCYREPNDSNEQCLENEEKVSGVDGLGTKELVDEEVSNDKPCVIKDHYRESDDNSEKSLESQENIDYLSAEELNHYRQVLINSAEQAFVEMQQNDNVEAWKFIEHCDALYDLTFKDSYADYVFEQWLSFLEDSQIDAHSRLNSLHYLDYIFDWSGQITDYEIYHGEDKVKPIFDALLEKEIIQARSLKWFVEPRHTGPIEYAGYYKRLGATSIDILLFYIVLNSFFAGQPFKDTIWIFLGVFIVVNAILEASPLQGSLGQVLFDFKVASPKGRRLNIFHALWRQLVYTASTLGFKFTIWINFLINDGRMLHDRLSLSVVIKR